jgi:hypothetical protein
MLRDAALQRLYEMDPAKATPYILDEIRRPHVDNGMFTVKAKTLGVLPSATLPEFDQTLLRRLELKDGHTMPLDAQLIGRYSTKAILPRVKVLYESAPGRWGVSEDGFLLYFLRVEPDYGAQRLKATPSACTTESMPAVIKMKRWDEVETSVIAELNNSDLSRARQAAEALAKYGDDKAEAALWEGLRRFHQQWAKRENNLTYRAGTPRDASEAIGFQYGLGQSLAGAEGWLINNCFECLRHCRQSQALPKSARKAAATSVSGSAVRGLESPDSRPGRNSSASTVSALARPCLMDTSAAVFSNKASSSSVNCLSCSCARSCQIFCWLSSCSG